jgi:tetratricopeptide (TPR) repeat protein
MSIFKCKMCGGTIEFEPGATVGICDSCGTKQTLPRLDDDKKANLYDRANHYRRNNDFDKAMGIYEQILNEDSTDAEAYWSLVLCRYGIEYVEDPTTHKRTPTVNRAQFTSVYADEDYKSALQYADASQREIYEQEAKTIDDIQKGILEISAKEEPFDIFICFKETDASGRRTPDSVLATDLYHQLTQEGFKVFFSRITLEDKLGTAYEPYIFAALNSAKVMVVVGTKPEYFNAVWVKNEWSRYLALIKRGQKKTLIPAYRDMDPYDLPEEFSHLQAQDMSKLGFMQDLIRGIKKIMSADAPKAQVKETVVVNTANANTAPLLRRAAMFLEDGDWASADEYCEKVLDIDPENAEAYLYKLMAELHVRKQSDLKNCGQPFDGLNNYQKVMRFGDADLKEELIADIAYIKERNENERISGIYKQACKDMEHAAAEDVFNDIANRFASISNFKNAAAKQQLCREKAEECRKNDIYDGAVGKMSAHKISEYENAIKEFESISGWRDADEKIVECQNTIEEIKRKQEAERIAREKAAKKTKRVLSIAIPAICAIIAIVLLITKVIIPNNKYNAAVTLMNEGKYEEAIAAFGAMEGYKDSTDKIEECNYSLALCFIDEGNVIEAYESLRAMDGYKDSAEKAKSLYERYKSEALKAADVGDYIYFGTYEQDNDTSNGKEDIEWLVLAKEDNKVLVISRYALDCRQYNTEYEDITWETCTLRAWLNGTFLTEAFSEEDQSIIQTTKVSADKNPDYSTDPGNATKDKIFLLSINEAEKYFASDEARMCVPTAYAIANGAWTSGSYNVDGEATCWWWLRSPGHRQNNAAYVRNDGGVYSYGSYVNVDRGCVRPALWINLYS